MCKGIAKYLYYTLKNGNGGDLSIEEANMHAVEINRIIDSERRGDNSRYDYVVINNKTKDVTKCECKSCKAACRKYSLAKYMKCKGCPLTSRDVKE